MIEVFKYLLKHNKKKLFSRLEMQIFDHRAFSGFPF
ncbi:hypothetical protein SAMN05444410_10831 [Hydrobacter penzbergensis]|uniref:Uncharacterized protein n=1 Tax=Hydrobacter penzbergensis TaxID=1235997 RepID=A0A8X8IFT9_9BACT|nr:hypothetical protein SAMN05444410_10831 [Hydrobacter penzbergensis]